MVYREDYLTSVISRMSENAKYLKSTEDPANHKRAKEIETELKVFRKALKEVKSGKHKD